ncbi:MAG: DNA gyrase subunit A [Bacteroides sp.]|nr:DNA gyrase subunit A [Bacteroidales bacterium]MDD7490800.1 DNA gyrase subunit A [Bacteroides sp.]MDY5891475.1 DNA gyrase subunit A [Candidatus Cryptobacteroides sp.]
MNDETRNLDEVKEETTGIIEPVEIDHEMRTAYIDYSMSVIVSRALPDARDGLKPVQRRVLFGMDGLGLNYGGQTKKSARIVGEVLGKFHPHGDSSVYDAMARLAQNWNQRYPLVYGQGNFGSMDGDPVAAMRYTEAKLEKMAEDVLGDIEKNTVDMTLNFDDSLEEPTVLPTKAPLLLLNGSSGIAVGMATNMAPHNLGECCDAICAYIDNPDITTEELMEYIKGPDFPTGGIIMGRQGIVDAYNTGRGRVVIRAKAEIEEIENGREAIVVTEVPYMVNKADMLARISEMVRDKKIEGISDIRELTSREGIRIEFIIKKDANASVVLNTLYKYTALQSSFSINNVALVNGRPRTLTLKDMLSTFVDFRHEVVVRRTRFELDKAQKRAHILEGLLKAIDVIDEIIAIIKASSSVDAAKMTLSERFGFDDIQASAIVEMRLRQLTGLEKEKLQNEYDELEKFIARCEQILASDEEQLAIVKKESMELKAKYGDARRSEITLSDDEFNPEDFYADEDVVITISHLGYIKRTSLTEFKTQARGGVGKKASSTREEDFIEHIYVANMHSTMLLFTDKGMCYRLKVYELPEGSRTSKGRAVQNLLSIDSSDSIRTYLNVRSIEDADYTNSHFVTLVTKRGVVKKTTLSEYSNKRSRNKGIIAINIREGDELLDALLTDGTENILIAAKAGRCCRFNEMELRALGRNSSGVRGISIEDDDEVIGAIAHKMDAEDVSGHSILVVSENGFGKRSDYEEYRLTSRGAKGVKTINITDKTGTLVAIKDVTEKNDLMIITKSGLTIRMAVSEIRIAGRATQGVKLINIREGDSIAAVCPVAKSEDEEVAEETTQNED